MHRRGARSKTPGPDRARGRAETDVSITNPFGARLDRFLSITDASLCDVDARRELMAAGIRYTDPPTRRCCGFRWVPHGRRPTVLGDGRPPSAKTKGTKRSKTSS